MGIALSTEERVAPVAARPPTVSTVCSHSSLQIFYGAKAEGLRTLGICAGTPPKYYDAFPLAKPDEFLSIPKLPDLGTEIERLKRANAVLIPHGSFVEYLGPERFVQLDIPVFGNRAVIGWESDREKEREWLESAGVPMPKRYATPEEVDGPAIVK
jgi:5-formaminoimidazole-4-carboxamide-1-(beta)-D-ribofuranosyl 5'-monophosphate synthetase